MKPQVYLPSFCSSCSSSYLLLAASAEHLTCPKCGGTARVVPGESYGDGDVPLFERVAAAVDSDLRTVRTARKIMAELHHARGGGEAPEAILLRLTDDLPGLRFLIPALYPRRTTLADRQQMTRAMGMLLSLSGARLRRLEVGRAG